MICFCIDEITSNLKFSRRVLSNQTLELLGRVSDARARNGEARRRQKKQLEKATISYSQVVKELYLK